MKIGLQRLWLDQQLAARTIVGSAALYAVFTLVLQLLSSSLLVDVGINMWHVDSPVEICMAVIVLGGLVYSLSQLVRHRGDAALRLGWAFAAVAMALIATADTADWFNDSAPFWNEEYWFEAPLWLIAALCLYQCTRLYAAQPRVRTWFRGKVAFPVRAPRFQQVPAAQLVGARLSNLRDHDAAYLVYEINGSKVSVFVFDPTGVELGEGDGELYRMVAGRRVFLDERGPYNVALFSDRGVGYAITGDVDEQMMLKLINASLTSE